jgi:predicted HAD superfamily phosphohydrolase YqeG
MLVKQQKVFRDNTLIEKINYSYELDEQKNWIKKVATHSYTKNIYNQNKQDKTETRTRNITYFEE